MNKPQNLTQQFLIEIVSPVHLGCDEVYEPSGFILDEDQDHLITFNPTSFIAALESKERQTFSRICQEGTIESILELYKFMRGRKAEGNKVEVCAGFKDHFQQVLALPKDRRTIQQELNHFIIERTTFNPNDDRPYIPGSAIKGALRTAYLNQLARSKSVNINIHDKYAARKLEESLLDMKGGDFASDPFRMLKVSDFQPVGETRTRVMYAVNRKKEPSRFEARGPYQIIEALVTGGIFTGTIQVLHPEKSATIMNPLNLESVLKGAAWFFNHEKKREDTELKKIAAPSVSIEDRNGSRVLLRLGRHSGAESITIEGNRNIMIMKDQGRKEYKDHATTLWLAAQNKKPTTNTSLFPFGWVVLEPLSETKAAELKQKEEIWREQVQRDLAERVDREKTARERLATIKIQEEAERVRQQQIEEEEIRKKASLEAMSPLERNIAALNDPATDENQIYEIYRRLSEYEGEDKKMLAQALRDRWVSGGKWEKKDCSKKQWDKVLEIRAILGQA